MFQKAYELDSRNLPFAIVTIIGSDGIVPRKSGRMLVTECGEAWSTVGGHLIEDAAIKASIEAIKCGKGRIIDVSTGRGIVRLMVDVVNKAKRACIIGYGHVGRAVASVLHSVGYAVYIYDVNPVDCPFAAEVHAGSTWDEILSGLVLDEYSALVVTIHSKDDVLSLIDYSRAFYVGAMASRSRIIPDKRISAPIGLDIDAQTPEEVAVSIAAEIMRRYSGRTGLPECEKRRRFVAVIGSCDVAVSSASRLRNAGYDVILLGHLQPGGFLHTMDIMTTDECFHVLDDGFIPVFGGSPEEAAEKLRPSVAVIAGSGAGSLSDIVPLTIAIGSGLSAPSDADIVIDAALGDGFGRIIRDGCAGKSDISAISGYLSDTIAGSVLESVDSFFLTF